VGERHQRRKITELKTNVEKSLWFTKSFGLTLNSVTFSGDDDSNDTVCFEENVIMISRTKRADLQQICFDENRLIADYFMVWRF